MMQHTLTQLRQLKLTGMANALRVQNEQHNHYDSLSFAERIQLLIDHEQLPREQRKQQRLFKSAKLKLNATAKAIDYTYARGLKQSQFAALLSGDWVYKLQNVLFTGLCGCGKTYLACALAESACMAGCSAKYFRLS